MGCRRVVSCSAAEVDILECGASRRFGLFFFDLPAEIKKRREVPHSNGPIFMQRCMMDC
jgi:hypothetical protein